MYNLLIVEDDPLLSDGLVDLLSDEGYLCHVFGSVEAAEEALNGEQSLQPDLCLLDRNLPGANGDQLCKTLRRQHPTLPILILSARDQPRERVDGLKAGADDYLTKPFLADELIVRLAAMRRRIPWLQTPQESGFWIGDRRVDSQRLMLVFDNGDETALIPRDLHLLELLHQHKGKAVSRDQLYDRGWGREHLASSRALDQYMVGLRQKIRDDEWFDQHGSHLIKTVRGVGYCLKA